MAKLRMLRSGGREEPGEKQQAAQQAAETEHGSQQAAEGEAERSAALQQQDDEQQGQQGQQQARPGGLRPGFCQAARQEQDHAQQGIEQEGGQPGPEAGDAEAGDLIFQPGQEQAAEQDEQCERCDLPAEGILFHPITSFPCMQSRGAACRRSGSEID